MTGRRTLAGAGIVLVALVIAVGVTGAVYFGKRMHDGSVERFDAVLAELKARGEPVASDDLVGPPLADGDDGGPLLREAWAWLDENAPPREKRPTTRGLDLDDWANMSAEERARHAEFMESVEPFLQLVHAAVERRAARVFVELDLMALDRLGKSIEGVQTTMRLLGAASVTSDDPDGRLRALRSLGLLGARLETISGDISALMAIVTQRTALEALRENLERDLVPADAATVALAPLLDTDLRSQLRIGMRGARAQSITVLRMTVGDRHGAGSFEGPTEEGWLAALSRASMADFATRLQRILDAEPELWSDLTRRLVELRDDSEPGWLDRHPGGAVVGACGLLLCRVSEQGARTSALQSLARLSLAAVAEFDRTGAWPASLDAIEVPGSVRIDPFTDAPFVFELLPDGVRISSPGPTDAATWGTPIVEKNAPAEDGLIWTLRR